MLLGVPVSALVPVLKLAHAGRLVIENARVPAPGLVVAGAIASACPARSVVGGLPLIVGGEPPTGTARRSLLPA